MRLERPNTSTPLPLNPLPATGDGRTSVHTFVASPALTLHFNGLVGTITPPHLGKKALLRQQKYRDAAIKYVKATVPDSHPLVAKGWRSLPAGVTSLPLDVAMPSE